MILSLHWLKDYVKFKQTPEQIAEVLTLGGFEVEKIERHGEGLEKVIVGQIKTIVSHPGADKLVVCKVDVKRSRLLTIVCGAKNIKPEQKVPVALVGAALPSGMKIEARRIRGVDSEGMLCAEDELGLGDDHSGILILGEDVRVGAPFAQALKLFDVTLDVTVSPNRPDCLSVIGLAREIAALTGQKFIEPKIRVPESKKFAITKQLKVQVRDYTLCPKYTARVVRNVHVAPSPYWMQSRLRAAGVKPINTIVDITNYVMLEYGQPLHAFDYSLVRGKTVVVRAASKQTEFITLDGEARTLAPGMLMICDAQQPIAVAGVMGGRNSEITKQTKDIVIESAIFKPLSVRKTRQKLGIITEASTRFEKGIWWGLPERAVDKAAELMAELAHGEVATGSIVATKGVQRHNPAVKVTVDEISALIGHTFQSREITGYLQRLGFAVLEQKSGTLAVTAPEWRQDIFLAADVIEEVGRMHGCNRMKPVSLRAELKPVNVQNRRYIRALEDALVACGMTETLNYSYHSEHIVGLHPLKLADHYRVKNPLNPSQAILRSSLIPQLVENVLKNYQSRDRVLLFEVGAVFSKRTTPRERMLISAIVYDKSTTAKRDVAMAQIKDSLTVLMSVLGIDERSVHCETSTSHEVPVVAVNIGGKRVGIYGWISRFQDKLGSKPAWFELDIDALASCARSIVPYRPFAEFPSIVRDMTFNADPNLSYHAVVGYLWHADPLVVDAYGVGQPFQSPDNRYSVTFRIVYQSPDRTLTAADVDTIESRIVKEMKSRFGLVLKQ
ncbi:MAG: phenylalanine--tRNA ligase subunit beta [Patescibacteria group bacterium]|nr:phenylalanine--tRNA ligase subunit beta [Patescibacteria group bacterium]MDD5716100.1 phenylalanine--tRNA ligase subunit beta [Patescibacteria group bacterium]